MINNIIRKAHYLTLIFVTFLVCVIIFSSLMASKSKESDIFTENIKSIEISIANYAAAINSHDIYVKDIFFISLEQCIKSIPNIHNLRLYDNNQNIIYEYSKFSTMENQTYQPMFGFFSKMKHSAYMINDKFQLNMDYVVDFLPFSIDIISFLHLVFSAYWVVVSTLLLFLARTILLRFWANNKTIELWKKHNFSSVFKVCGETARINSNIKYHFIRDVNARLKKIYWLIQAIHFSSIDKNMIGEIEKKFTLLIERFSNYPDYTKTVIVWAEHYEKQWINFLDMFSTFLFFTLFDPATFSFSQQIIVFFSFLFGLNSFRFLHNIFSQFSLLFIAFFIRVVAIIFFIFNVESMFIVSTFIMTGAGLSFAVTSRKMESQDIVTPDFCKVHVQFVSLVLAVMMAFSFLSSLYMDLKKLVLFSLIAGFFSLVIFKTTHMAWSYKLTIRKEDITRPFFINYILAIVIPFGFVSFFYYLISIDRNFSFYYVISYCVFICSLFLLGLSFLQKIFFNIISASIFCISIFAINHFYGEYFSLLVMHNFIVMVATLCFYENPRLSLDSLLKLKSYLIMVLSFLLTSVFFQNIFYIAFLCTVMMLSVYFERKYYREIS